LEILKFATKSVPNSSKKIKICNTNSVIFTKNAFFELKTAYFYLARSLPLLLAETNN